MWLAVANARVRSKQRQQSLCTIVSLAHSATFFFLLRCCYGWCFFVCINILYKRIVHILQSLGYVHYHYVCIYISNLTIQNKPESHLSLCTKQTQPYILVLQRWSYLYTHVVYTTLYVYVYNSSYTCTCPCLAFCTTYAMHFICFVLSFG